MGKMLTNGVRASLASPNALLLPTLHQVLHRLVMLAK